MKIERWGHCALSIGDKIYVFGGENDGGYLSSIECSDGIGRWSEIGKLREKRFYLQLTFKFKYAILLFLERKQQALLSTVSPMVCKFQLIN